MQMPAIRTGYNVAGPPQVGEGSPFDLTDDAAYRRWRDAKLADYPSRVEDLIVEVDSLANPTAAQQEQIRALCRRANMAVYVCRDRTCTPDELRDFAARFGLRRLDTHPFAEPEGVAALEVRDPPGRAGYIPYTDRAISWHTDGYYNPPQRRIDAIMLHCVRNAEHGGVNDLLDPELAYIGLRDADPGHVAALMHADTMMIPGNRIPGKLDRPDSPGPVFSVAPETGALHMRYTARPRNVVWRDDDATVAALAALRDILEQPNGPVIRHKLEPGQGLICNNVLHTRSAFQDRDPKFGRLLYRARFLDRVGTPD